ncbi:TadE family protein [Desertibacillus haloalkaliphilus]|uniref:TadE family protein n=1 Tax=Desertibacillus haloalkaliphilus TaxID=1328930 RepID=UPI001C271BA9|nr:TadE/TadG family type IV pilus assembly protein [Desertibacillus haloalkaliphilus]MBU8908041.1 pilus assembly protein [Desertibacillus haloalkaliphilus]
MNSEKGQTTVELALSVTVILLLIFGMVDFGRIFHANLVINHAGREAARMMSVGGSDADIIQSARTASASLDATRLTVSVSPSRTERRRGVQATVVLSYSIQMTTPFLSAVVPNPLVITNRTVARME